MIDWTRFSPRPWSITKDEDIGNPDREVTIVRDRDGNRITDNERYYPAALKPKNAVLIAAAPELLQAVWDAHIQLPATKHNQELQHRMNDLLMKVVGAA